MAESHAQRKLEHLDICTQQDVTARGVTTGLERYRLPHCALPELDLAAVDLSTTFLGKRLRAPVLISAITGGASAARDINRNLAAAAQRLGLAMGVGSQRAAIEDPRLAATYQVRDVAPDILLLANLGAVQLNYGYGVEQCRRAVEMIGADALVLHLNPLQEALQPGGNTRFAGLLARIEQVCQQLTVPVVVKEVGWGISAEVARALAAAGVAAIDTAGAGGTSWSEVERYRTHDAIQAQVAATFRAWGIPTADSIRAVRQAAPDLPLIASGGIYDGPSAAVALALSADLVGLARPLVAPATSAGGDEQVEETLRVLVEGLRVAMFAAGIKDLAALKQAPVSPRISE